MFLDFVNAYGDKFLSFPLFPKEADVAEYINLILFFKQKSKKLPFVPIVFDCILIHLKKALINPCKFSKNEKSYLYFFYTYLKYWIYL